MNMKKQVLCSLMINTVRVEFECFSIIRYFWFKYFFRYQKNEEFRNSVMNGMQSFSLGMFVILIFF